MFNQAGIGAIRPPAGESFPPRPSSLLSLREYAFFFLTLSKKNYQDPIFFPCNPQTTTSLSGDHHFCRQLGTTQSNGPTTVLLPFSPHDCASISASDCCGCAQGSFRRRHLKPCESFNGPTAALYDCKLERDRCTTMYQPLPMSFFFLFLLPLQKKQEEASQNNQNQVPAKHLPSEVLYTRPHW